MGLDSVELVMCVEDAFEIEINDEDASRLVSVELLHEHVVLLLGRKGEKVNSDKVLDQIRALIVDQLGVSPDDVVKSARFVQDLKID